MTCVVVALAALPLHAETVERADAADAVDAARIRAAVRMMAELRPVTLRHAAAIREAYERHAPALTIDDRDALAAALAGGHLVPLPQNPHQLNLRPRLEGRHPIGEKDLAHQPLYVSARPETLGCLLHVASRVAAPLEITSLVRHHEYQRSLARSNRNARTAVPTHVMGLAFDISILHLPLERAEEIRDVLLEMAEDGDLYFLAEQRQLVFHVVPAPDRRSFYESVFDTMTSVSPPAPATVSWPKAPSRRTLDSLQQAAVAGLPPISLTSPSGPAQYAALFSWLVTAGLGVPPGEDLLLVGAGALVSEGVLAWWPVLLLAVAGVVGTDTMMFLGGRAAKASVARRRSRLRPRAVARFDRLVHRWGAAAIALARFLPGTRALVFASAGARGVSTLKFLAVDLGAALLWVPLVLLAGGSVAAWLLGGGAPALF